MREVVKTPLLGKASKEVTYRDSKMVDTHGIMGRSIDSYMEHYKKYSTRNSLVGIAVTYNVPAGAFETLLSLAFVYRNERSALKVLDRATHADWRQWDSGDACDGSLSAGFVSPFIGRTTQEMVQIVRQNHESTCISGRWFYIADQRTAFDGTLLLVEIAPQNPERYRSVRVFPALVNREAQNLVKCQGGFQFLLDNARNGSVYRGYEYYMDDDLDEHVHDDMITLLEDATRSTEDLDFDDQVPGVPFRYQPSLDGEVDLYRGYVDQKEPYEPSECDTVTINDLGPDIFAEPEQNSGIEDNGSDMNVVDGAQTEAADGDNDGNGDVNGAHNGEIDGASASDEGYVATDEDQYAEADVGQALSDEGFAENENFDGGYVHEDNGDTNDSALLTSIGALKVASDDYMQYLATPEEVEEGDFDDIDEEEVQTQDE